MKLVTFDAGRVGRLEDEAVVELDCASTREYFERSGQHSSSNDEKHWRLAERCQHFLEVLWRPME